MQYAAVNSPQWRLYYWAPAPPKTMKGRGEYVRLMFEAAQCPYSEENDPIKIVSMIDRSSPGTANYPAFAPPMLEGPNGIFLSQTIAILAFLGKQFGFYPEPQYEFHAMQVALSVADFHSEGRACFHPIDNEASYYVQVDEAKVTIAKFCQTRLPCWLGHFDHVLSVSPSGFAVGNRMSYADIALFHVLSAAAVQFPDAWNSCSFVRIKEYIVRIASFQPLALYLASERCRPWEGNSMM